jgi:hypothetical protein
VLLIGFLSEALQASARLSDGLRETIELLSGAWQRLEPELTVSPSASNDQVHRGRWFRVFAERVCAPT